MKANRHQMHLISVEDMTAEAIDFLREHEPPEGYFVGFSGGKDSIVTYELCRMAGVKCSAHYSCTRIDPPEIVRFIREHYPEVGFLYPRRTYWACIRANAPPLRTQRWCCNLLKETPGSQGVTHKVVGVRAEESSARAARDQVDWHDKFKLWQYKPIFYWTEYHVWEFITNHNLPYPSLYDEGWDRIGCILCPFWLHKGEASQRKLAIHRERWPQFFKVFERAAAEWHEARERKESFEEFLAAYYRGFESCQEYMAVNDGLFDGLAVEARPA